MIFCVGVMYSGEYDACDVTLSVYPHRASLKNRPDHGGNRTYDLWNTSPMLCQLSYAVWSVRVCDISEQNLVPSISMLSISMYTNRPDRVAQLVEHWASIPKVVGSIPTVSGIFLKLARCGYTLRVTSQASSLIIPSSLLQVVNNLFQICYNNWEHYYNFTTHVKISQLVNKMCSQQACSKLVNKL